MSNEFKDWWRDHEIDAFREEVLSRPDVDNILYCGDIRELPDCYYARALDKNGKQKIFLKIYDGICVL